MESTTKIEVGITTMKELTKHVPRELVHTFGETVLNIIRLMFKQESVRLNVLGMEVLEIFEIQKDPADQYDTLEFLHFLINITKRIDRGSISFHEKKLLCLPAWKCLYQVTLNENHEIIRSETFDILPVVLEGMSNEEHEIQVISSNILHTLIKSALLEDEEVLLMYVHQYLTKKAA